MQCALSQSKQVGLFPCRGSVVPCRTLSLVSATCHGTVKPGFARPAVSEREAEGARKTRQGQVFGGPAAGCRMGHSSPQRAISFSISIHLNRLTKNLLAFRMTWSLLPNSNRSGYCFLSNTTRFRRCSIRIRKHRGRILHRRFTASCLLYTSDAADE